MKLECVCLQMALRRRDPVVDDVGAGCSCEDGLGVVGFVDSDALVGADRLEALVGLYR